VVTKQVHEVFAADRYVKAAQDRSDAICKDLTHRELLVQGLLRAPLKPGQIRIISPVCVQGTSWLLGLALFSTGVFLASL